MILLSPQNYASTSLKSAVDASCRASQFSCQVFLATIMLGLKCARSLVVISPQKVNHPLLLVLGIPYFPLYSRGTLPHPEDLVNSTHRSLESPWVRVDSLMRRPLLMGRGVPRIPPTCDPTSVTHQLWMIPFGLASDAWPRGQIRSLLTLEVKSCHYWCELPKLLAIALSGFICSAELFQSGEFGFIHSMLGQANPHDQRFFNIGSHVVFALRTL